MPTEPVPPTEPEPVPPTEPETEPGPGPATEPGRSTDAPGVGRLLSLSDGVVAIALTLLVLQLKVPVIAHPNTAATLAAQLGRGGDQLISYAVSFYVIGNFWLTHHRVFRMVSGHHEGLAWWNFAFLFTITVMPFTSDLLGSYSENPLAVDIFAANLILATLATQGVVVYGLRKHMIAPSPEIPAGRVRSAAVVVVAAVSIGVAWAQPDVAKLLWLLIMLGPWVSARWMARYDDRAAPPHGVVPVPAGAVSPR